MKKPELFYNAKVITVDAKETVAEAFAVEGGKFAAVGKAKDLLDKYGAAVKHDLKGKTVVPGLNDGHAHPVHASLTEAEAEIPVCRSVKEALDWIGAQAASRPKGEWIVIQRIYPTRLTDLRYPTLEELDKAAPGHPVFLEGAFGGMVNSCALAVSNITAATPHPGIVKDTVSGKPVGIVQRPAFPLLKMPAPREYSRAEQKNLLKQMLARYNSVGITSLSDTLWEKGDWQLLTEMAEEDALTARFHLHYMPGTPLNRADVLETLKGVHFRTGSGDEWLKIGPYKIFLDGGLLTATGLMLEPWGEKAGKIFGVTDKGFRGNCSYTQEPLNEVVLTAAENGFTFITHATGDGAVDMILKAYEAVDKKIPIRDKKFTLLHGNFFPPQVLDRCAGLGVVLDIQAAWLYKDLEALTALLGERRMAHFHPYRDMVDKGLLVCGGSDHMAKFDPNDAINPYNPFIGMYALTTHRTERGTLFKPEQAMTRREALKLYTVNNAIKSSEEKIKGSIEPGKLADFVVLEKDLLSCSDEELRKMKVMQTYLGGEKVFGS